MKLSQLQTPLVLLLALVTACGDGPAGPAEQPEPSATTGTLVVSIDGLPASTDAAVALSGPNGFSQTITGTRTLTGLAPGTYSASITQVSANGLAYGTAQTLRYSEVVAGGKATVPITYEPLNLRTENAYITQSIQAYDRSIPLVAGRDGMLRVFGKANISNTVQAPVRARLFHNGELKGTLSIPAPTFAAPMEISEASLATSWNVRIPGSLIQPGLSVLVDIDPEGRVAEGDEADNRFPASGSPQPMDVRVVPRLDLVFVPIRQPDGTLGNITEANKDRYLVDLLRMFPVADIRTSVREPYVAGTQLRPSDGWTLLLSELEAVRVGDGRTGQYYYGVATINYTSGIYGVAYRPGKTALGNDYLDDRNLNASMTLAHELGHSMGRPHSQCGSAGAPDVDYPHANGQIGSFGLDLTSLRLYAPATKDLMGYCEDRWIGDFTYQKILEYRATAEARAGTAGGASQSSLVVWGHVSDRGLTLEPAFQADAPPALPDRAGPYRLEGLDESGAVLFSMSFAGKPVEHSRGGDRIFAFALPREMVQADRLATLRLSGDGQQVSRRAAGSVTAHAPEIRTSRGAGGRIRLDWDAEAHPLAVLRDSRTGNIISLARGGSADLKIGTDRPLDLLLSDGLRSQPRALRLP